MKHITGILFLLCSLSLSAQNGLHFDGTNDFVQTPFPGPIGNNSRTVETWIKISSISSNQRVIMDYGDMAIGNRFTF